MTKMKIYFEILVPTELVEKIMEYLENEGFEVEKSVPANSEWVSKLAGPGIGYLSSMHSETMFYDIVFSDVASEDFVFEDYKKNIVERTMR